MSRRQAIATVALSTLGVVCAVVAFSSASDPVSPVARAAKPRLPAHTQRRVVVPDIVGDHPSAARKALARHRLKPAFLPGVSTNVCLDPAPSGRVLQQSPKPGTHLRSNRTVYSPVDALRFKTCPGSPRPRGPSCPTHRYSVRPLGGTPEYTGGSEDAILGFRLHRVPGPPCVLNATGHAAVLSRSGSDDSILGNPVRVLFHIQLRSGIEASWAWSNWCGPKRGLHAVFRIGSVASRARIHRPKRGSHGPILPFCTGRSFPSRIVPYTYYR
jgi:hypothetical protein